MDRGGSVSNNEKLYLATGSGVVDPALNCDCVILLTSAFKNIFNVNAGLHVLVLFQSPYNDQMKIISALVRFALALLVITLLGQVKWRGRSLENSYHSYVNSSSFQKTFWTLTRPATWTYEKVTSLIKESEKPAVR